MNRKVIAISVLVGIVGIGLGVVIGYFSHPTNTSPGWVDGVQPFFEDVDDNDVYDFIDGVDGNNIKSNLQ